MILERRALCDILLFCMIQFTWTKHFGEPHKPQFQSWQQPSPSQ